MSMEAADVLKVLLAVVAGGLIGLEREFRDKAAGFRTLIFICTGSTLFTIWSQKLAHDSDPTRIAANIVSGVGFLGAGVILREGGRVVGLTTAATIWLTAALGMGIGGGHFVLAGTAVLVALVVLWVFPLLEEWVDNIRHERTYEITCPNQVEKLEALEGIFRGSGLRVKDRRQARAGGDMRCSWEVSGPPRAHDRLLRQLMSDAEVMELRY